MLIKKRKLKAMERMLKKRDKFFQKNEAEIALQDSNSEHNCILCHEALLNSKHHPYGVTGYIGINRLYYHAHRYTVQAVERK